MEIIKEFSKSQLKKEFPEFRVGDRVKVEEKIVEQDKSRIQIFEGIVIARRGSGISETFTVRKVSHGVGVEKTFPLHSPFVQGIVVVRRGRVRRAKLYYLRKKIGRKAKVEEKEGYKGEDKKSVPVGEEVTEKG